MKIYSKLLGKIKNNKARVKNAVGIVTVAVGLRYGRIHSSPTNLSSNFTQQVEQVHNYVEEDMEVINIDGKVKDGLSPKSSSHLIKTGSGILIGNQQISEGSKSALIIRSGADDPTKFQIICDISSAPTFLQKTIIKNITQGFDSNQLKNINFLF